MEVIRTRCFAKKVVELLRHALDLAISFNKLIPDTVEIREEGEERLVQLVKDKMIWVVGEQVECIVKSSRARSEALDDLEMEYHKTYGHNIPMSRMGVARMEELVAVLQSWVRMVDGKDGVMVVTVDRGFIRTMASNVRKLMVEQETGAMVFEEFVNIMASRSE